MRAIFEPASASNFLTSYLTSFLRCHKYITNLPQYFGYTWPNMSKIILSTCKDFHVYHHPKHQLHNSILSWDIAKTLHTCYFEYFRHVLPHPSKTIESLHKNIVMLIAQKINFIPPYFLEYCKVFTTLLFWIIWAGLTMPTMIN